MLTTDRCLLTKPQEQDRDGLRELHTDPEARKYLGGPVDEQVLEQRISGRLASHSEHYWVIRRADDRAFVGTISLDPYHDGVRTEVSYQLLPRWWGQGYGTEVVRRVICHAFDDLGLPELVAETQSANKASCRLLEKVGMTLEQTLVRFGAEQSVYRITR